MGLNLDPGSSIDEAILPRLPWRFYIELLGIAERKLILKYYLKLNDERNQGINVRRLAAQTLFHSGSDLCNLATQATLIAIEELANDPRTTEPGTPQGRLRYK
jgi:SpoVK/Ycf46/Vps4 family AAA+-type ATPase